MGRLGLEGDSRTEPSLSINSFLKLNCCFFMHAEDNVMGCSLQKASATYISHEGGVRACESIALYCGTASHTQHCIVAQTRQSGR